MNTVLWSCKRFKIQCNLVFIIEESWAIHKFFPLRQPGNGRKIKTYTPRDLAQQAKHNMWISQNNAREVQKVQIKRRIKPALSWPLFNAIRSMCLLVGWHRIAKQIWSLDSQQWMSCDTTDNGHPAIPLSSHLFFSDEGLVVQFIFAIFAVLDVFTIWVFLIVLQLF